MRDGLLNKRPVSDSCITPPTRIRFGYSSRCLPASNATTSYKRSKAGFRLQPTFRPAADLPTGVIWFKTCVARLIPSCCQLKTNTPPPASYYDPHHQARPITPAALHTSVQARSRTQHQPSGQPLIRLSGLQVHFSDPARLTQTDSRSRQSRGWGGS